MNKKMLLERKEELRGLMNDLLEGAKTEKRALNDEEVAKFDEYEKEIKNIDFTIQRMEQEAGRKEVEKTEEMTVEERESKQFVDFIRGLLEKRADVNLTYGDNGAIIPKTIANKIVKKAYDMSSLLTDATKYNTKGSLIIPVYKETSAKKLTMAYASEFVELESNIGTFDSVELANYLAGALAIISKSLVANTDIDLENVVVNLLAETVANFMEKECLYGTTQKVAGLSGVTMNITTASATTITAEELIKLKNKVKKQFRNNAKWIMSPDTLAAIETLTDSNGRFLFREDMASDFDGYLLGYPVETSDNMADISAGKTVIYFGDLSGLALKQKQDALELNVLREKYATQHAVGINAWVEFDAKVEHEQKIAKLVMKSA